MRFNYIRKLARAMSVRESGSWPKPITYFARSGATERIRINLRFRDTALHQAGSRRWRKEVLRPSCFAHMH